MTSTLAGETIPVGSDGNFTYKNLQTIPTSRPNGTLGGCFGLGPGNWALLYFSGPEFFFQIYEFFFKMPLVSSVEGDKFVD
jgi:hypothetical protein